MMPTTSVPYIYHPSLGAVSTYNVQTLPDDPDTQVAITIGLMQRYAAEDALSSQVQYDAATALAEQGISNPDPVQAMWDFVRSRMTFRQDAVTGEPIAAIAPADMPVIEVLIRPRDMHTWGAGDCDDFSTYGASLLTAMEVPCAFVTVAADSEEPSVYSHVYLCAYPTKGLYAGMRVPLDLSHGKQIGWETQNKYGKRREWAVSGMIGGADTGGLG